MDGWISGLFVSMDETVAESHEQMGSCVRFIKQNKLPPELGTELKDFFSMDMNQKCSLSLADQDLVYRNLPLSIQVEVRTGDGSSSILHILFCDR